MADEIYQRMVTAYANVPRAESVFPSLTRQPATHEETRFVTARFEANDGGAWLLSVSGDVTPGQQPSVEMMLAVADGGTPPGFVEDLCAYSFEACLDLSTISAFDKALVMFLKKAVTMYEKMNGVECDNTGSSNQSPSAPTCRADSVASGIVASPSAPATTAGGRDATVAIHVEEVLPLAGTQAVNVRGLEGAGWEAEGWGAEGVERQVELAVRRPAISFREPVEKPVNYKPPEFTPSSLATATLKKQLSLLAQTDTKTLGFVVEPVEENLYKWRVQFFYTDLKTKLARDLAAHPTHDHVEMEFCFPSGYPFEPPFCRVVAPAFVSGTGHVQSRGGLCMELLTGAGWTPANSMDAVCIQLHWFLTTGEGTLDLARPERSADYTHAGALQDLHAVVRAHRWDAAHARSTRKRARGERS